jgi:thiosulfate/3-mercaptopyruvate sulfurtransferase
MLKSKIKRKNSLIVAAISVGLVAGISVAPSTAAPKNLARSVVQTDWLEKNLDNPDVKIIEVSTEAGLYERGHIKNAVKFNWYTDLVEVVNRDIVSRTRFEKLARAAGINKNSTVVL